MSIHVAFEWDEGKRLRTLAERGLDFCDATLAFDGRPAVHVSARQHDEDRFLSIASLNGKLFAVVWTWRGATRRIISFRRARDGEARLYRSLQPQ